VVFAQALQAKFGCQLWALARNGSAEHAIPKVGDQFLDASGPGTLEELAARLDQGEGRAMGIDGNRSPLPGDLPNAPRSLACAETIAALLPNDEPEDSETTDEAPQDDTRAPGY